MDRNRGLPQILTTEAAASSDEDSFDFGLKRGAPRRVLPRRPGGGFSFGAVAGAGVGGVAGVLVGLALLVAVVGDEIGEGHSIGDWAVGVTVLLVPNAIMGVVLGSMVGGGAGLLVGDFRLEVAAPGVAAMLGIGMTGLMFLALLEDNYWINTNDGTLKVLGTPVALLVGALSHRAGRWVAFGIRTTDPSMPRVR